MLIPSGFHVSSWVDVPQRRLVFVYEDLTDIHGNFIGSCRLLLYKLDDSFMVTTQSIIMPKHFYQDSSLVYCQDKVYMIGGLMVNN
jgi:hypothetical protein